MYENLFSDNLVFRVLSVYGKRVIKLYDDG